MSDDKPARSAVPYEQLRSGNLQAAGPQSALATIEESRVIKAAEARVILAKRFPRDEEVSRNKILKAFENPKLADAALYSYPRGNETVEDLSIRAAETMAGYWGNLEYGIQEIERAHGYSEMLAYCWDLEGNVYHYRAFKARHWRDTRSGGYAVKDERDIYEVTFNLGARRLRSCILEALPAHIKEEAESIINETLRKAEGAIPIEKRVTTMLEQFEKDYGVKREQIEKRLGHSVSAMSETEMVGMRKIFKTLKDSQAKVEDFFDPIETTATPTKRAEPQKPAAAKQKEPEQPSEKEAARPRQENPRTQETEKPSTDAGSGGAPPESPGPTSQKNEIEEGLARLKALEDEKKPADTSPMPELTFAEAFAEIAKARTVEDLDVVRSRISHLKESQQKNLNVSITNKIKTIEARGQGGDSLE